MIPRFLPLGQDDPRNVASYVLRARLGSGGMGRVYLSFTPGGRAIAIKVVRPDYAEDPEFRARFRREVIAAQRVQGIYTAPVIDADVDAPIPWLATAYVPGPSLHRAVAEHGPLPIDTVSRLMGGVAEGLASVHAAGLIHRDLKPANVLLAEDGPRVIDFGIAHAADATTLTKVGVGIGTPAFMAPEQVRGQAVSPATDIFALGHLAFYAGAGHTAFGEGHQSAIVHRIGYEQPNLEGCPAQLRALVERCLQKDPADRPTMSEIIEQARALYPSDRLSWLPPAIAAELAGYDTTTVFTPQGSPAAGAGQGAGGSTAPAAATGARGAFAATAPLKADAPGDAPPQAPAVLGTTAPVGSTASTAAAANAAGGIAFLAPTTPPGSQPPHPYQSAAAWPGAPGAAGGPTVDHHPTSPLPYAQQQPTRRTAFWLVPSLIGGALVLIIVIVLAAHAFSGNNNPTSNNTPLAHGGSTAPAQPGPSSAAGPTNTAPTGMSTELLNELTPEYTNTPFSLAGASCVNPANPYNPFTPSYVTFTAQDGPQDNVTGDSGDIAINCNDGPDQITDIASESNQFAKVTGAPSVADCYNAASRNALSAPVPYSLLFVNEEFCLIGSQDTNQLVFLTLTGINDSTYDLAWTATAWELPADDNGNG